MRLSRRDLMRAALASGVALACPSWLHAGGTGSALAWNRRLVLVELDGGNDGLNTFVPWQSTDYNSKRRTLKLSGTNLKAFADGSGVRMNWNLVDGSGNNRFLRLFQDGRLAVALGVGMADQSRSHFRGMDVWNSGSDAETLWTTGWLQRSLGQQVLGGGNVAHGILIDRPTSNPLAGTGMKALAMRRPKDFLDQSKGMTSLPITGSSALQHVLGVRADIVAARNDVATRFTYNETSGSVVAPTFTDYAADKPLFPSGGFGSQCRSVAEMICTDVGSPVYKIRIGGFDNHSGQLAKHNDLLAQLAHGLTGLADGLHQHGKLTDTLIMTYSEFGRRVEENGSDGTDHGTLAPHVLISHETNFQGANRIHGTQPSLVQADLDNRGDLKFTGTSIDYRRLYATALRFLGMPENIFATTYSPLDNLLTA